MSYEVKTPVFEGPLDLLLQLITGHHLEVTELSLAELVSAYLAHLDLMHDLDLEVTSEFLVIASTLVQLKARSLLPGSAEIDLDDDLLLAEERDRLLSRLLANLTFKDVAAVFGHRLEGTELMLGRTAGLDPGIDSPPAEVRVGIAAADLAALAGRVLERAGQQPTLDHLDLDLPSVSDAITDLRRRLSAELEIDFEQAIAGTSGTMEVIAYFLAVLELARWGMIKARQPEFAGPISLVRTDSELVAIASEWDEA